MIDQQVDDNAAFEWITDRSGRRVKVLRDGAVARVRMHTRDSVQAAIAADRRARVTDATGDSGFGLHRPGARLLADSSAYDEVQSAYVQMVADGELAWKPVSDIDGSGG